MKNNNISLERKKYLNKIRLNKFLVFITQLVILVGLISLWEILANMNIIDSFITSQPSRILKTFINLKSNDLINHILVTTYETVVGFILGTFLGAIIAIILWWSNFLSKVAEPFLVVLNSLPKVALRTNHNYMGRRWNSCNYCNGNCHFSCRNYFRNIKWIYKY